MTQSVINNHLIKYLEIKSKQYTKDLADQKTALENEMQQTSDSQKIKENKNKIENINRACEEHIAHIQSMMRLITYGHCRGLAISHAAMDLVGSLDWWEKVLIKGACWDGSEATLEEQTNLGMNLDQIFQTLLNYLSFNQACLHLNINGFASEDMCQKYFLQPTKENAGKTSFEILNNHKVTTIKSYAIIAGTFSINDLLQLLDENQIKDNICLIGSLTHVLRLKKYNGALWMLYDSNYDHTKPETIHKIGTKEEMVVEIFTQLKGQSIALEVASITPKTFTFPYFDALLANKPQDLIKENGLFVIANQAPKIAYEILKQAKNNLPLLNEVILTSQKKNTNGGSFFNCLIRCSPEAVSEYLKLATQHPILLNSILRDLQTEIDFAKINNAPFASYLGAIVKHAPKSVPELLKIMPDDMIVDLLKVAQKTPSLRNDFLTALTLKNHFSQTSLHIMLQYKPKAIFQLFKLTKEGCFKLPDAIAECLKSVDDNNVTGLESFFLYLPNAVPHLLELSKKSSQLRKTLFQELNNLKYYGDADFEIFFKYAPNATPHLFRLGIEYPDFFNNITHATLNHFSVFTQYAAAFVADFFKLVRETKNIDLIKQVITTLKQKDKNNLLGFQTVFMFAPNASDELFLLIKENALLKEIEILLTEDIHGSNLLFCEIVKQKPTFLFQLMQLAEETGNHALVNLIANATQMLHEKFHRPQELSQSVLRSQLQYQQMQYQQLLQQYQQLLQYQQLQHQLLTQSRYPSGMTLEQMTQSSVVSDNNNATNVRSLSIFQQPNSSGQMTQSMGVFPQQQPAPGS